MRNSTLFLALVTLFVAPSALSQSVDYTWIPSQTDVLPTVGSGILPDFPPYRTGLHSGSRGVRGPCDIDGDGNMEVFVTDYTGGGRVYWVEEAGPDMWEVVLASPSLDSTSSSQNARTIQCTDLDDDGMGELVGFLGRGYDPAGVVSTLLPSLPGLAVIESDGDNSLGLIPTVYGFPAPDSLPDRIVSEMMSVMDVDGDGVDEVMFPNNGGTGFNYFDNWYVMSVTDLGPLATWNQEARWSSRASEDFDPVDRGGGSAYSIVPADLDGDGTYELSLSSWNNLNFTNVDVTGADTYDAPEDGDENAWYRASGTDEAPLFGCIAVDIDMNGDDEVFCPAWPSGNVTLLNYEDGEDASQIVDDNVVYGILPGFSALGLAAGDIDNDGLIEIIGSGPGQSATDFENGIPPRWLRIADISPEMDIEDPASYSIREIEFPGSGGAFNKIYDGDMSGSYRLQGAGEFTSKIAFLGDPDNDGDMELAFGMQSVPDSIYVSQEIFNPPVDTTIVVIPDSTKAYANRSFLRIFSGKGLSTNFTEDRIILPSDYVLGPNYPNPFNPATSFSFTLPLDKRISVLIYDVTGRLVRTLINEETYVAGTHQVTWHGLSDSGNPVASGQYFYVLRYGNFQQARPMQLIK